jgi:hypothetical protein
MVSVFIYFCFLWKKNHNCHQHLDWNIYIWLPIYHMSMFFVNRCCVIRKCISYRLMFNSISIFWRYINQIIRLSKKNSIKLSLLVMKLHDREYIFLSCYIKSMLFHILVEMKVNASFVCLHYNYIIELY